MQLVGGRHDDDAEKDVEATVFPDIDLTLGCLCVCDCVVGGFVGSPRLVGLFFSWVWVCAPWLLWLWPVCALLPPHSLGRNLRGEETQERREEGGAKRQRQRQLQGATGTQQPTVVIQQQPV